MASNAFIPLAVINYATGKHIIMKRYRNDDELSHGEFDRRDTSSR